MPIKSKFRTFSTVVKGLIIGAIAVTRASAVIAPPAADATDQLSANWDQLKGELDSGLGTVPLRPELEDILDMTDLKGDLDFAIRTSYAIASSEEVASLDARWLETFIARGNSEHMAQYFALRTSMGIEIPKTGSNLDWWLWNAWGGGGGDCDGGGGSD